MNFFAAKSHLRYFLIARHHKGYGIHSPFLFKLITEGLSCKFEQNRFSDIKQLRKDLLRNKSIITINDMGAGSKTNKLSRRMVSQIARTSLTKQKYIKFLVKLIRYFSDSSENFFLELGTSLGITALYIDSIKNVQVTTVEGSKIIGKIALSNFTKLKAGNIHLLVSEFSDAIADFLIQKRQFDFIFIDGNHRYQATKNYFEKMKLLTHNDSVLVFDDIHWSKEMQKAWHEIIADKSVTLSLDIFQFGIVFFKKELSKQHFILRY